MYGVVRRIFRNERLPILVLTLMVGIGIGYGASFAQSQFQQQVLQTSFYPLRSNDSSFSFTHPLIAYETPQATTLPEYADLKRKVESLIKKLEAEGNAETVSVHYRDIEKGRWIGINDDIAYHPASLLKVPLMIAYFKARESNPSLFKRQIIFKPVSGGAQFEAPTQLVVGKAYTVQKLIESMIVDSDNGATFTLFALIDPDLLTNVYRRLGITDPGDDSSTYRITGKTYALFFRTLYNGTYLTPSASEEALALLARATYKDGLVAGIPKGTVVAHKFGEHIITNAEGAPQGEELHDCGIVYRPNRPYLLCVMTRAKSVEGAQSVISQISRLIYENESEIVTQGQ